ncbi:MAG: sensor histidine kinase [Pseudobutyrivibrio sp.]|nr:sensor histidine kinase [Pseudobutyrivibrio sp.]
MKKIKHFFSKSLYLELSLAVIFAMICGFIFYFMAQTLNSYISYSDWATTTYTKYMTDQSVKNLQNYIDDNKLSTTDYQYLSKWSSENYLVYFYIIVDDVVIYNSYDLPLNSYDDISDYFYEYQSSYNYDLTFTDTTASIYIYGDYGYGLYIIIQNLNIVMACALVVSIIVLWMRRKIHYIYRITKGISILEGGNLDYQIPVEGADEISNVAESLNSMRIALAQQMENEKKALQANNSLVTALSHDLRTPLTTQMGYLEILKEHHYNSKEEMDKYVNTALETCHQIKEMSDRLFEYFLAFDPNPKRPDDALEIIDGMELFMQLIGEHALPLENQGYSFDVNMPDSPFTLKVNLDDILRIFNNVFTNIDKYADEQHPIIIDVKLNATSVFITFANLIRKIPRKNESAKIGLISINSLMKRQGGSSITRTTSDTFSIELKFPLA